VNKKIKVKKTAKEIAILNRNGQIKVTLESILKKRIKSTGDDCIKYTLFTRPDSVTISLTSEYKIGSFVNFALLKEISNKLNTDLIDLRSERRYNGDCDTCDIGAESTVDIVITL